MFCSRSEQRDFQRSDALVSEAEVPRGSSLGPIPDEALTVQIEEKAPVLRRQKSTERADGEEVRRGTCGCLHGQAGSRRRLKALATLPGTFGVRADGVCHG